MISLIKYQINGRCRANQPIFQAEYKIDSWISLTVSLDTITPEPHDQWLLANLS